MHQALSSVGKKVLIIDREDKIIGEGTSHLGRSDDWQGIRIESGEIFEKLKDLEPFSTLGMKHIYIRYMPNTGFFLSISSFEEKEMLEAVELLENTRAVDKFNLGWGMVPEYYKGVSGYRASMSEHLTE